MSGILRLESLTKGNTLKQGDKTPLKYRLFDADGEKLNIAGKTAKVRLVYPDFLTIGYEKDGLTVAQDDTVTFTIDGVIPSRIYHVEIIVDDKFIFPSRADESKFTVDKSSLGTESNIVEIVGVDAVVRKAVDLINEDPNLIIDEDKLVTDIISNTGIGNINEYYKAFNDLKPKAEQSITKSAEALTKSQNALNVANGIDAKATNALSLSESADTLSKSVQEQFNQVIIDGDSSVEAAQARVDASGQTNPTLKARLDKEHNEVTAQLAHTDDALNKRVDNLVIPISPENANIEVTDSHVSTVKNKTFDSLKNRLEEGERDIKSLTVNLENKIVGGSDEFTFPARSDSARVVLQTFEPPLPAGTYYFSYNLVATPTTHTRNTPEIVYGTPAKTMIPPLVAGFNTTTGRKKWYFSVAEPIRELRWWSNNVPQVTKIKEIMLIPVSNLSDSDIDSLINAVGFWEGSLAGDRILQWQLSIAQEGGLSKYLIAENEPWEVI